VNHKRIPRLTAEFFAVLILPVGDPFPSQPASAAVNRPGMSETASNGQLSGLLGCLLSVVRSFEFGGRDVAAVFVQAPVVEPIDPFGGRDLDLLDRFPGLAGFDQLGFVQPVDRFCQRIIV
jgi:hypothetical protein